MEERKAHSEEDTLHAGSGMNYIQIIDDYSHTMQIYIETLLSRNRKSKWERFSLIQSKDGKNLHYNIM